MGWSDEIYARGNCPFCRLLVDMGDTNMSGGEREVEFWSVVTLLGREVLSSVAEPLYDVSSAEGAPAEAIYLALVRTIKPPPHYGFDYRTLFKEITYVGMLETKELFPDRAFGLRHTGDIGEIVKRVRSWLGRCTGHEKCRARKARASSHPDGFRLFDVTSLRVVSSRSQEPYIALSYSWAQVERIESIERGDSCALEAFPVVLQDMIKFVRALDSGINHIWMDRLCIDQHRSVQKRANIDAMGTIYGAAFATIILTMPFRGGHENGLPGLSTPRELYQRVESSESSNWLLHIHRWTWPL